MTREERNIKLKHLITCMKCEVSGKVCDDNCPTQYEAGNMGEIIKNLEAISKMLEQEPCEDAISRKAAIDYCYKLINVEHQQGSDEMNYGQERVNQTEAILHHLELMPSVTPQSKTGQWNIYELAQGGINEKWLECSECKWSNALLIPRNYCPKCGARMMEKEDDKE